MKPKYIIDDLVWYDHLFPCKVTWAAPLLGEWEYNLVSLNSRSSHIVREHSIKPIYLTSEILEKNGWHKQASNHEVQGWSNGHVKIYPQGEKFGGGFMFLYSGNAVQYIHHVHQLQHLLWALGIDDNLKI